MRKIFTLVGRIRTEGLQTLRKGLKTLDKDITRTANKINRFGKNVQKIGVGLTKLTAPIAAVGIAVVKFGADFDKAMTNSLAIMGDLSDAMRKDMSDAARAVAKVSTFSAKQAAEAYFFLASAGYSAANAIKALPRVTKFAQAGNFDLALATDLLTDAISALGLASKNVAINQRNMIRVSDVLVKANTLANASVQQFSESLTNRAGAALKILGKDIEEGIAVLAAYADQGVKGAEAGTQLGIVLRDLQKASLNNRSEFEKHQIAVYDNNGEMRNMAGILKDLENALAGMSDKQKKATISSLGFQEKSIASLLTLIGTSDAIKEYEKNLRNAAGITDEVANKQLKSFWAQVTIAKNRLVDMGLTLWETAGPILLNTVIPAFEKFTKKIEGMLKAFKDLSPAMKASYIKFSAFAVILGPLFIGLGKIISSVKILNTVLQATIALMSANPYILAIAGLAALTLAVVGAVKAYKNFNKEVKENAEMLRNEQIIGGLQEIIYHYEKLQNLDKVAMSRKEYLETKKNIDDTRQNLKEYGIVLSENLTEGLRSARLKLIEFGIENKKVVDFTKDEAIEATEDYAKANLNLADALDSVKDRAATLLADIREYVAEKKKDKQADKDRASSQIKNAVDMRMAVREQQEAAREGVEETDRKNEEIYQRELERRRKLKDTIINGIYDILNTFQMASQNRIIAIDNEATRERRRIEGSLLSEKDKSKAIIRLEEDAAKKKRAINRRMAALEKVSAIFSIGISTAQAIMKSVAQLGPIAGAIAGVVMGILGAAQIAIVASKPLPEAKEGALIQGSEEGVAIRAGEGRQDELILPLKAGVKQIVNGIMESIVGMVPSFPVAQPAFAVAGGRMSPGQSNTNNGGDTHWHIGTLVADEFSLKQLDRRMSRARVLDAQRKGA